MPKYLIEANYVGEGINGLLKEGGTKRRAAVDELFKSMGGAVEAFYYAFGDKDVFIIGELPDNATAAALALRVNASGAATCKTIVLMTPQEVDEAVKKTAIYRPPGYELDQAEVAKWDNEGGQLPQSSPGAKNRK
ncbi:GYD domain-containing protein [Undibacterium arcticum]|uniref:GYD domain-containing protein n=1 Tax=Undibacterium arcticum TaxID=1762892 RepID=A0ABV7EW34_9BURK